MTGLDLYRPSPLETAWGWVPGMTTRADLFRPAAGPAGPGAVREALESCIRPALVDGPCFVGFSGGRDSSAVLAVAVDLARREGLAPPVPLTEVFDRPEADEAQWQEAVVRHLGLTEWIRLRRGEEADLLGPAASEGLRHYGLVWPALLHGQLPVVREAAGGWLLSGEGGDEVFGPKRVAPLAVLLGRRARLDRHMAAVAAYALAPRAVRGRMARRSVAPRWLRPAAASGYLDMIAETEVDQPLRWDRAVVAARLTRSVQEGVFRNMSQIAADQGVRWLHPLLDGRFLDSLARTGGRRGFTGRGQAMQALFGDLLPSAVLTRSTKASFNTVAVGPYSRDFAHRWTGTGLDEELVDPAGLRDEWLGDCPDARSFLLLQAAWLATEGSVSTGRVSPVCGPG